MGIAGCNIDYLSTAIIDQTGFKSWMIWAIEPSMLRIGLQGNDIVPLLEGFDVMQPPFHSTPMPYLHEDTVYEFNKLW